MWDFLYDGETHIATWNESQNFDIGINPHIVRVTLSISHNITKILLLSILSVFMDGVLDGEESYERGEATARWDICTNIFMNEYFIQIEYIITLPSLEYLASDRHTSSGDDRHISVKHELSKFGTLDNEGYLYNISTDAVRFSIANCCIRESSFVRWIIRIFNDEILGWHIWVVFTFYNCELQSTSFESYNFLRNIV